MNNCVGYVVIGLNEGEKLQLCLTSILIVNKNIVYVDSGSIDGSVIFAKSLGIDVVELDMSLPFTAGRARNEGAKMLLQNDDYEYIHFIDGDCQLEPNWTRNALVFMEADAKNAIVYGHLRERNPEKSIFNALCQIEWDTPLGDVKSCGGIALVRANIFKEFNGFRGDFIAGEEPELCFRLRSSGWKIRKIDYEMAVHDAEMYKFSQWWKRRVRCGFAFTEGTMLHGLSEERYWIRDTLSIFFWGIFIPLITIILCFLSMLFLIILLIYPIQYLRIVYKNRKKVENCFAWAFYTVLGKFPEAIGLMKYVTKSFKRIHLLSV